jgi:glycosyltransferase involved in cell wall biosynthesis
MSLGLFILSSLAGEAASLLAEHEIGDTYEPENLDSFMACLLRSLEGRSFAAAEREAIRQTFESHYDSGVIADRMINELLLPMALAQQGTSM